ncbi:MAG: hypothetical protein H7Y12_08310 [Sphingobacteriaceae bacterium]|nr:hypothetical protein [Cytophagaceae bacterium]
MMTKTLVADALHQMPEKFSMDELFERLILIEAIEQGRRDYAEGKTISHEQMAKELDKWLK